MFGRCAVAAAVLFASVRGRRLSSLHPDIPAPTSQEACTAAAAHLGLVEGGVGYDFVGQYTTKGCYTYKTGNKYAGHVYYGTGGTEEQMQSIPELPKYRLQGWEPLSREAYLGCWMDIRGDRDLPYVAPGRIYNADSCQTHCRTEGYQFAALQYPNAAGAQCWCGDEFGRTAAHSQVEDSACGDPVTGDNLPNRGGAAWRNAIYTTGLEGWEPLSQEAYLGCWMDIRGDRDLPYVAPGRIYNADSCQTHCRTEGYQFAALQYPNAAGAQCWCGDEFGRTAAHSQVEDSACGDPVTGDNLPNRGGAAWRNAIYTTGLD